MRSCRVTPAYPCTTSDGRMAPDTECFADYHDDERISGKPYDAISYLMGDYGFNMGRSLLVTGALMGSDVRRGARASGRRKN